MFQIGWSKQKLPEYLYNSIPEEFCPSTTGWVYGFVMFCPVLFVDDLGEISHFGLQGRFPIDSVDGRCTVPNFNAATPPEN